MDRRDGWGAEEADRILRGVLRQNVDAQERIIGFARGVARRVLKVSVSEGELQASAQAALLGYRHAGLESVPPLASALLSFGLSFLATYAFYLFQSGWLDSKPAARVGADRLRALRLEAEAQALEMVETRIALVERCLKQPMSPDEKHKLKRELAAALFHAEDAFYTGVVQAIERIQRDGSAFTEGE